MNKELTTSIIPIQILNVRVFLIQAQTGWVLVDTGLPLLQNQIKRALKTLGVSPADIRAILLTHGHLDHIGGLVYLKEISGAEIICHQSLAPILKIGHCEQAVPRAPLWKLFNDPVHNLLASGLRPVHPDRVFAEELDLTMIGLSGRLLHTPGHSPSSSSICLESGDFLTGDLLRETASGQYDTGLFYADEKEIYSSLKAIEALEPNLLYLSHGGTLSGEGLAQFLKENYPGN
jgi:hydroxyacylglutathione hydrolase